MVVVDRCPYTGCAMTNPSRCRAVEHEAIPSVARQASLHVTAEFDQTGDPDDPPMRVAIGPSASRCSHGSLG